MRNGLVLARNIFTDNSTIGDLYLDGEYQCNVLEDSCRKEKVFGKTAIPAGDYEVVIRYSNRFKRDLPALLKVPYFDGILIHPGNSEVDTLGCLLLGIRNVTKENYIVDSRKTFDEVFPRIQKSLEKGRLSIHIYGGFTIEDIELAKKYARTVDQSHSGVTDV